MGVTQQGEGGREGGQSTHDFYIFVLLFSTPLIHGAFASIFFLFFFYYRDDKGSRFERLVPPVELFYFFWGRLFILFLISGSLAKLSTLSIRGYCCERKKKKKTVQPVGQVVSNDYNCGTNEIDDAGI